MLMAGTAPLTQLPDFALGAIRVSPARRVLEGEQGPVTVEPLVMKLLVELSRNAGRVVTRRTIFDLCWGASSVGDDSLNRIVAALRKALDEAGEGLVTVETVPRTGYLLRLHDAPGAEPTGAGLHSVQRAVDDGLASIWHGLPQPDNLRLEALRRAVQAEPDNAARWVSALEVLGLLAACMMIAAPDRADCRLVARVGVGLMLILFGAVHWMHREAIAGMIPEWMPGRELWPLVTGAANVTAGLALVSGVLAKAAAALAGAMFASWIVLVHLPRLLAAPGDRGEWVAAALAFALTGVVWTLQGALSRNGEDLQGSLR